MPMRPTPLMSPWLAMPTTSMAKSSGAMMTLIRRRKIVPRNWRCAAAAGQSWPNSAPENRPTAIQVVSDRRAVA